MEWTEAYGGVHESCAHVDGRVPVWIRSRFISRSRSWFLSGMMNDVSWSLSLTPVLTSVLIAVVVYVYYINGCASVFDSCFDLCLGPYASCLDSCLDLCRRSYLDFSFDEGFVLSGLMLIKSMPSSDSLFWVCFVVPSAFDSCLDLWLDSCLDLCLDSSSSCALTLVLAWFLVSVVHLRFDSLLDFLYHIDVFCFVSWFWSWFDLSFTCVLIHSLMLCLSYRRLLLWSSESIVSVRLSSIRALIYVLVHVLIYVSIAKIKSSPVPCLRPCISGCLKISSLCSYYPFGLEVPDASCPEFLDLWFDEWFVLLCLYLCLDSCLDLWLSEHGLDPVRSSSPMAWLWRCQNSTASVTARCSLRGFFQDYTTG